MEHDCECCANLDTCRANKATDTCACTVCPCTPAAGEVAEEAAEPVVD